MPCDTEYDREERFPRYQYPYLYYSSRYFIPLTRAVCADFSDRILLIRRRYDGRWALPAGSMMPGESAQECLERVVRAQTGLTVIKCAPFIADSGKYVRFPGQPEAQMIVFGFRVREWEGELMKQTAETLDARWLFPKQACELLGMWNEDVVTIEDHVCTDYDPPMPAEGGLVWVR